MKKTLSLLIAAVTLSAFMIGCSKPEEGDNAATTGATTATGGTTEPKTTSGDPKGTTDVGKNPNAKPDAGTPGTALTAGSTAGK